jgi:hypothetical protein
MSVKDARLRDRSKMISSQMRSGCSSVIHQFSKNRKEEVAACRFFNNEKIKVEDLVSSLCNKVKSKVKDKVILCVEDSSEFNYTSKSGRIDKDSLGGLTAKKQLGFFIHPMLVVDAKSFSPLGLSNVKLWKREENGDKFSRDYANQSLEQKESFRWIETMEKSASILKSAKQRILVADREADIYSLYIKMQEQQTDYVIRMRGNRLSTEGVLIKQILEKKSPDGLMNLKIKKDVKDNRSAHQAKLEVRYGSVEIRRPKNKSSQGTPRALRLNVVQAKESARTVRKGEKSIEWNLLTSLPLKTLEDARMIITYYSKRWLIEEFFAILKSRGLNLEKSQLNNGQALMKLAVIAMETAVKTLRLTKGRADEQSEASIIFSTKEIALLHVLLKRNEGKTKQQKNPFKKESLAWSAWIIARMGGWKGYTSETPPGNKTMSIGLQKFLTMMELYDIMT